MNSSKYINLYLIALLCVGVISCDGILNGKPKHYTGPAKLEMNPLNDVVGQPMQVSVSVQLFGKQRSNDLAVNFSVDDSSTARAGTDYTILTSSPITIPADSSAVPITINVDNSQISSNSVRDLYISLDGTKGGKVEPAVNLKTYHLVIRGAQ